jgi:2'-5' RNA ligase
LAVNQVPITTKLLLVELLHIPEVTRSNFKNNEESPYKPEMTLLRVRSRSESTIDLIIAPKELQTKAKF